MNDPAQQFATREELARVESAVENVAKSVSMLTLSVDRMAQQLANTGRMNWPLAVGVTSILWGIVLAGVAWGGNQSVAQARSEAQLDARGLWIEGTNERLEKEDTRNERQDVEIALLQDSEKRLDRMEETQRDIDERMRVVEQSRNTLTDGTRRDGEITDLREGQARINAILENRP